MQARRIVLAATAATALAVAPLSVASAHTGHHEPHAAFVVAGVSVQGHHRVFNVAKAPATVNIKVKPATTPPLLTPRA